MGVLLSRSSQGSGFPNNEDTLQITRRFFGAVTNQLAFHESVGETHMSYSLNS